MYVNTIRLRMVLIMQYIMDGIKMTQFNGEVTVSLKISLLWKLAMEEMMIVLATMNLMKMEPAIPMSFLVTLFRVGFFCSVAYLMVANLA